MSGGLDYAYTHKVPHRGQHGEMVSSSSHDQYFIEAYVVAGAGAGVTLALILLNAAMNIRPSVVRGLLCLPIFAALVFAMGLCYKIYLIKAQNSYLNGAYLPDVLSRRFGTPQSILKKLQILYQQVIR